MLDYFYGQQSEQFTFYRMPKVLFTDERFKRLSTEAKLLYGLFLDRMNLSAKNDWGDSNGRVYIIYTLNEIQNALNCKDKKATKLLNELEKNAKLIERKRLGQGKPSLIYVKNFIDSSYDEKVRVKDSKNDDSTIEDTTIQDTSELRCNNIELNEKENNYTNPSIYPINSQSGLQTFQYYEEYFKKHLDFDSLLVNYSEHSKMLEEILELLVDSMCSKSATIRIGGEDKPSELVKNKLLKLNNEHIQYVMDCLMDTTTKVKNIRQYLITSLYNAINTIDSYYTKLVQHDLKGFY